MVTKAQGEPFDAQFDIDHVRGKFPLLRKSDWLEQRMGKAITQRRQYLRYCRQQRDRLNTQPTSMNTFEDETENQKRPAGTKERGERSSQAAKSQSQSIKALSTLAVSAVANSEYPHFQKKPSNAHTVWTLRSSRPDKYGSKPNPYGDSTHSLTFFREHVLRDLRPYLCTFEECDMKIFADRDTWFNHELRHHRVQRFCPFCTDTPLQPLELFESHLQSCHAQKVTTEHITALAEACQRSINKFSPQDCPFCDEWSTELRNANPELS